MAGENISGAPCCRRRVKLRNRKVRSDLPTETPGSPGYSDLEDFSGQTAPEAGSPEFSQATPAQPDVILPIMLCMIDIIPTN